MSASEAYEPEIDPSGTRVALLKFLIECTYRECQT